MKYRIISILVAVAVIIVSFAVQNIDVKKNRYHQHREAVPKAQCTDHDESVFCTHLPLISITTDEDMHEPYLSIYDAQGHLYKNESMVGATVEFYDSDHNNHLMDVPTISERGMIRIR